MKHLRTYGQLNEGDAGGDGALGEVLGVFGKDDFDKYKRCADKYGIEFLLTDKLYLGYTIAALRETDPRFLDKVPHLTDLPSVPEAKLWKRFMDPREHNAHMFVVMRLPMQLAKNMRRGGRNTPDIPSDEFAGAVIRSRTRVINFIVGDLNSSGRAFKLRRDLVGQFAEGTGFLQRRFRRHASQGEVVDIIGAYAEQRDLVSPVWPFLMSEMVTQGPWWEFLQEYSLSRQEGDPSLDKVARGLLTGKFDALKASIARNRRTPGKLMSVLRRKFPEEYEKAFPDDTESELGEMGF